MPPRTPRIVPTHGDGAPSRTARTEPPFDPGAFHAPPPTTTPSRYDRFCERLTAAGAALLWKGGPDAGTPNEPGWFRLECWNTRRGPIICQIFPMVGSGGRLSFVAYHPGGLPGSIADLAIYCTAPQTNGIWEFTGEVRPPVAGETFMRPDGTMATQIRDAPCDPAAIYRVPTPSSEPSPVPDTKTKVLGFMDPRLPLF